MIDISVGIWVAKAIGAAVLGQGAKDAYGALRDLLVSRFNLGTAVAVIEAKPEGDTQQKLLAEQLVDSEALVDPEFLAKVDVLVAALKDSQPRNPQAQVLIENIRAEEAVFRDILAEGSASVIVKDLDVDGTLTVENVKGRS